MKVRQQKQALHLITEEPWTRDHAHPLRDAMLEALESNPCTSVVLDLHQVGEMDTAGLKLLLGLFRYCTDNSLAFRVEAGHSPALAFLKACRLQNLIHIEEGDTP